VAFFLQSSYKRSTSILQFALCVFLAYLLLVVCTCLLFLLVKKQSFCFAFLLNVIMILSLFLSQFYSDATGIDPTKGAISAQSVLLYSIGRYNANKNVADFIDYLQEQVQNHQTKQSILESTKVAFSLQMECCGSTSFRDWHLSEQFSCNATNPYPERLVTVYRINTAQSYSSNVGTLLIY